MVHGPGFPANNKPLPTTHNGDCIVYMAWGNLSSTDIDFVLQGGRRWTGIVDLHAKCAILYLLRLRQQHDATDTFTAAWLRQWNRFSQTANPPEIHRMPQVLAYLHPFFLEWAYFGRRLEGETQRALRRRIFGMLREYNSKIIPPIPTRIGERYPSKDWRAIWGETSTWPISMTQ
jgi:hypothetical protein